MVLNRIMKTTLSKAQKVLLALNILIILGFAFYFGTTLNYEFLAYVVAITVITIVLFSTLKYTKFSNGIILGITIWALLHMLGGSVLIDGDVLYAYKIFPFFDGGGEFYILKYDQIVHAFLYGVIGVAFFDLLREVFSIKKHMWLVALIAVLASAGLSSINEIIEFGAVITLPETGVGGYYNTLLDFIFNLGGAIVFVGYKLLRLDKK